MDVDDDIDVRMEDKTHVWLKKDKHKIGQTVSLSLWLLDCIVVFMLIAN